MINWWVRSLLYFSAIAGKHPPITKPVFAELVNQKKKLIFKQSGYSVSSHFVASEQGTSAYDVAGFMLTAFGLSASHAEIAATAANLEATAMSGFKNIWRSQYCFKRS